MTVMRRNDREITDRTVIDDIIGRCTVCRLGMCDEGEPYIVPLSFGYDGRCLYFHAAPHGRKLDVIRRNSRVCFEFDILNEVVGADQACNWSMRYESVMGRGTAEILDSPADKMMALSLIMGQYSDRQWQIPEQELAGIVIIRVAIDGISGKARR